VDSRAVRTLYRKGNSVTLKRIEPPIPWPYKLQPRPYILNIQGDSKRWTQFRTSIFPELYTVREDLHNI
jgi:hypothetical protein